MRSVSRRAARQAKEGVSGAAGGGWHSRRRKGRSACGKEAGVTGHEQGDREGGGVSRRPCAEGFRSADFRMIDVWLQSRKSVRPVHIQRGDSGRRTTLAVNWTLAHVEGRPVSQDELCGLVFWRQFTASARVFAARRECKAILSSSSVLRCRRSSLEGRSKNCTLLPVSSFSGYNLATLIWFLCPPL
jgi:hypothetical protein